MFRYSPILICQTILHAVKHEEQAYNSCNGILYMKEGGYREQDFIETVSGLNKFRNTEMNDAIQDGQNQRNTRSASKRYDLCLIRSCFFTRNEIPPAGIRQKIYLDVPSILGLDSAMTFHSAFFLWKSDIPAHGPAHEEIRLRGKESI